MTVNTSKEDNPEFLKNIVKINNQENDEKNTFKN